MLENLQIIAFTHKQIETEQIGLLHLSEDSQPRILDAIKNKFNLSGFLFLSTCNRVELIFSTKREVDQLFLAEVLTEINPDLSNSQKNTLSSLADFYKGISAIEHLYRVASSLDSLVIGEREIITQVRKAFEICSKLNITDDLIRLSIKQTIETAKYIYTHTGIAKNPVSVVSLANRQLRDLNIKDDARILIVGAGETNTNFAKYLKKHKFSNFVVFNRTESKAINLAKALNGKGYALSELHNYSEGFDVLITCTSSQIPIITNEVYTSLINCESNKKVIIDLAVPNDIDRGLLNNFDIKLIAVETLKEQAKENLNKRSLEIKACEEIIKKNIDNFIALSKERKVELAFGEIPKKIKAIKELALNEIFAKDLQAMDVQSKEVLEKILLYMEKKYNAVAMKTAKEALLKNES